MAGTSRALPKQKWICFALGLISTFAISLFWIYPVLFQLVSGLGASSGYTDGFTWSTPMLFIALLLSVWLLLGYLALLRPDLIFTILPDFLKKNLGSIKGQATPESAERQIRHGRQFVLNSLAGRLFIWPAIIVVLLVLMPIIFQWGGPSSSWQAWMLNPIFRVFGFLIGVSFFIVLIARLLVPGILATMFGEPGKETGLPLATAWPFLWGLISASVVMSIISMVNILPSGTSITQTENTPGSTPVAGERVELDEVIDLKGAEHYVTWKDENFIPSDEPVCINGMSVFIPKDKGFVGHSLDPDSVLYDPYAYNGGAVNIEGSVSISESDGTGKSSDKASDMSTASTASEFSVVADEESVGSDLSKNPDWVRDLGTPWALGSVYYNGEDKLAGYDFSEGTRVFAAKTYVIKEGSETETDVFLVPGECGYGHTLGNGIRRQLLSDYEAAVHVVYPTGANHAFSESPYIPQDVSDILLVIKNMDRAIAGQDEAFEQMIKQIEVQDAKKPRKGEPVSPIIMVQRWSSAEEAENRRIEEEKLRKAIQGRLKSNSTWVHTGQLLPLCTDPTPACESLRNSLSIYVPRSKRK